MTYSMIHVAPGRFGQMAPYAIGLVELANGVRLTTQIVDVEASELSIGMPVRIEFRKVSETGKSGVICYGYKAVPA